MQKFKLELLLHIMGIGSASGLLFNDNSLFLISDNSNMLYEYNMTNETTSKVSLADSTYTGPLENIPKKDKQDFEAITKLDNDLYIFGSGSGLKEKRNSLAHYNFKTKTTQAPTDLTDLYLGMQSFGEISPEDFNIETAVNDGTIWYLFQRGNGPAQQNGLFTLDGDINEIYFQIIYNPITLPKINGAQASFTDAVKVGDKLYFIAAAEKSDSTYLDGEVAGSLIGCIDIETVEVEFTQIISNKNKFEGITLYRDNGKSLEFLLCEDTDSDATESDIYKLTIDK